MTPATKMYISCVLSARSVTQTDETRPKECEPSSIYPADDIPAHPHRVCGIHQPLLGPFQNVPLIHQIVQNRLPLRDEIVQRTLCVLNETMFSQRVVFPGCGHEVWWLREGGFGETRRFGCEAAVGSWHRRVCWSEPAACV